MGGKSNCRSVYTYTVQQASLEFVQCSISGIVQVYFDTGHDRQSDMHTDLDRTSVLYF